MPERFDLEGLDHKINTRNRFGTFNLHEREHEEEGKAQEIL